MSILVLNGITIAMLFYGIDRKSKVFNIIPNKIRAKITQNKASITSPSEVIKKENVIKSITNEV